MSLTITPSTRLAIQAAVAIAVASILGGILQFERSYWMVLTALLLVSQTWGESIKKSIERVLMTAVGGTVGTLLYFMFIHHPPVLIVLLFLSAFFTFYLFEISYLWTVFFLTIMVVFIFALLLQWNYNILEERIFQTFLGAVIAIVVTAVVFPIRQQRGVMSLLPNYLALIAETTDHIFNCLLKQDDIKQLIDDRTRLFEQFNGIRAAVQHLRYESLFSFLSPRKMRVTINDFQYLCHYTTNLLEAGKEIHSLTFSANFHEGLTTCYHQVMANYRALQVYYQQQTPPATLTDNHEQIQTLKSALSHYIESTNQINPLWLEVFSFLYFLDKINEIQQEMLNK